MSDHNTPFDAYESDRNAPSDAHEDRSEQAEDFGELNNDDLDSVAGGQGEWNDWDW